MRTETVTCDGCGADLTRRTNTVDYRLVLSSEDKRGYGGGFYTDVLIRPSIEQPHHFCVLSCLDKWRDRQRHYDKLWAECHDKWVAERGTKTHNVTSWPTMPQTVRDTYDAEFKAAALALFPMKHSNQKA